MNLNILKQSFLEYLVDAGKLKGRQESEKDVFNNFSDIGIFLYQNEFKEYLAKEYGGDISIFSGNVFDIPDILKGDFTEEDFDGLEFFDERNDVASKDKENGNNFSGKDISYDSIESINNFFADERIAGIFSSGENGNLTFKDKVNALNLINLLDGDETKISSDDISYFKNYVDSFYGEGNTAFDSELNKKILAQIKGLDGNNTDMSASDFQKLLKLMETMPLTAEMSENILNGTDESALIDEAAVIEANKIKNKNTHSSNYTGFNTSLKSYSSVEDIKTIETQISSKRDEIIAQNNIKIQAMAEDKTYKEYVTSFNDSVTRISEYETGLTDLKTELHDTQYDLTAAKEQLENLKDPVIFTEYQDDIDSLRESLKVQIATLTEKESTLEDNIIQYEAKLKEEEENNSDLKEQIRQYETNKPNDVIAKCNENISVLEKDIASLESQKTQKQSQLESQREEELSDAEVFGKSQAYRQSEFTKFMLDYAMDPETKKYYDDWYFREWNGHSYCAIFTTNVTELMYAKVMEKTGLTKDDLKNLDGYGQLNNGAQGIKGDQMGMHAIQWGNEIQPALDALGINMNATIDITKMTAEERKNAVRNGLIYPGMTFEYKGDDGSYHTGFVESINKDLSWTTIEGNIDIKYEDNAYERHTVGSRTVDSSKNNLAHMTDSTAKALIWAYQQGVLTIDEINAMTYAGIFAG